MVGALFDTNILIDHLNAVPQAREEIERFNSRAVSVITWMEVMVGADADLIDPTRRFLEGFKVIALDDEIANRAQTAGRLLVTRNTKDFPADDPGIREPYTL
jgi:predicted nucleic acid-binding protein